MIVIGPEDMVTALSQNLSPQLLAELACDLLAVEGHTNIKILDGPGDGCRDIHSIDMEENRTLSQCKFHQETSKTVSSKEMGELPMGMIKLGYRKGIFVTNVKISPQAKREYLDDYRDLNLNYLDGRDLVTRVLGNAVLKALWFDGEKIGRVASALVVPMIARDLTVDKPFSVMDDTSFVQLPFLAEQIRTYFPNLDINARYDVSTPQVYYAPYRAPKITTIKEGVVFDIKGTEFIVSGILPLENIDNLLDVLASETAKFIETNHRIHRSAFGIRVGVPSLAPLQGSSAGTRLELPFKPFTLLRVAQQTQEEHSWIKPSEESGWRFPRTIRASQFNQTRLHNTDLDVCVEYRLISPPGEQTRHSIAEQRKSFAWYWERSLFVLLPATLDDRQPQVRLPKADFSFEWVGNKEFKGWLYGTLAHGLFISSTAANDEETDNSHDQYRYSEQAESDLTELRRVTKIMGGEVVDPRRARYIVAAILRDPFPSDEEILYGTAELIKHPDDIPSPIDLTARRLEMTVCWNIGMKTQQLHQNYEHQVIKSVETTLAQDVEPLKGYVELDEGSYSKDIYVVLNIDEPENYDPICHIDHRLARFGDFVAPTIQRIELMLKSSFPMIKRATEEYWQSEYDMWF